MSRAAPEFSDVLAANTGYQVPTQLWESGQTRLRELLRQSEHLADQLESQGIRARQDRASIITVVGEVTDCKEEQRDFRPIRFLPVVAQRERQGMLNALIYFQRHAPGGTYMRYAVVTAGERVPAHGELRKRIQKLSRDVSRWASEAAAEFGIEVVYRGTEFTVDQDGTYHPHANVLYIPRRKLPEDEWAAFLSWSRGRLGAHWQDNGRLRDPNEAIKYPFKPADLDNRPAEEIGWLFGELFRLKLAQPLGAFKGFWGELETDKEKIANVTSPNGESTALIRVKKQDREAAAPSSQVRQPEENMLICRTAPVARFTPYKEPLTLVENYTENPKTDGGHRRLRWLRERQEAARAMWTRNGGPAPEEALALVSQRTRLGNEPSL